MDSSLFLFRNTSSEVPKNMNIKMRSSCIDFWWDSWSIESVFTAEVSENLYLDLYTKARFEPESGLRIGLWFWISNGSLNQKPRHVWRCRRRTVNVQKGDGFDTMRPRHSEGICVWLKCLYCSVNSSDIPVFRFLDAMWSKSSNVNWKSSILGDFL